MGSRPRVPENLKKQLALAVRTIQWSYGIFWSNSDRQPGVLEWGDGYYNGDIKTRKTVQPVEFNADQIAFQRSEQLKELYKSLSVGEASPQARRPSAALSPEDLTDLEWYYLVCMSFVFNIGQGLPGRTLATGQSTWLLNVHYVDNKVFTRSLLAKSASMQTVVCFPYLGGVIELGVTEMVIEDPSLIQLVKNSLMEIPYPTGSKKSKSKDLAWSALDHHDMFDGQLVTVAGCEEQEMVSLNNSSSDSEANQMHDNSFLVEGINGGASPLHEEFSNCGHNSMNSSDCISQTCVDPDKVVSVPKLNDLEYCKQEELVASTDHQNDDLHFQNVPSSLLKSSHQLIMGPCFRNTNKESSFVTWKKVGLLSDQKLRGGASQKLLKKVMRMHDGGSIEFPKEHGSKDGVWRPEADGIGPNHNVISEEKKREKLDKRFLILKTLVPSISEVDKVSILDTTIKYLKQLEKRVEELEPSKDLAGSEGRTKRKLEDTAERTSGNYGSNKTDKGKRRLASKRKAIHISNLDNLTVRINGKDVLIELRCPWREGLLLEIMDVTRNLQLDSHSVQSTMSDDTLSLTIKSKVKEADTASVAKIRRALDRFTVK